MATRERRETAFHARVHDILFGDHGTGRSWRAYREIGETESLELVPGFEVHAVECLLHDRGFSIAGIPDGSLVGLLALHVRPTTELDIAAVEALWPVVRQRTGRADLAGRVAEWLRSIGSGEIVPDASATPYTIAFSTLRGIDAPAPINMPGTAFDGWDALRQWTWLLGSLTPPELFSPAAGAADNGVELALSSSWSARVLRDGCAFVAVEQGANDGTDVSLASLALYAQTIYLDALMLGLLQTRWLNEYADLIGQTASKHNRELLSIEPLDAALSRFRAEMWWRAVAFGSHCDSLITALQEQNHLRDLLESSAVEIRDLVRQARTLVDQARLEHARRTDLILLLLTIFGLPSVPVLTVWLGISHTWTGLLLSLVIYVAVVVVVMLIGIRFRPLSARPHRLRSRT